MDRRLLETLEKHTQPLRGGEFIDTWNRKIRTDDVAGTIYANVDLCSKIFVTEVKYETEDENEEDRSVRL